VKLKSIVFRIIFLLISVGVFAGCSNPFPKVNTPIEEQYSETDFNNEIELVRVIPSWEKANPHSGKEVVSFGDDIIFDLINHSNKMIQFPPDGGAIYYVYALEKGEWVNIKDSFININENPEILLPKDDPEYLPGFYDISPSIPMMENTKKLIPFRVVVFGNIVSEGGEVLGYVGAFYDLFFRQMD